MSMVTGTPRAKASGDLVSRMGNSTSDQAAATATAAVITGRRPSRSDRSAPPTTPREMATPPITATVST